jgi:hypothetical protein
MKAKYECPNCNDPVLAARWNAGYQYCMKKECFAALGRKSGVPLHETPPDPENIDITPYDLDEVAALYGEGE